MYKEYEIKLNAILDKHKGVQKVELGLVQDLEKLYSKIIKGASTADKAKNNTIEKIRQFKSEVVKIKQDAATGLNRIEKFNIEAKKLGIDIPNEIKKIEKQFNITEDAMQKWQTAADKAMKLF
tara:strand:+ start:386 stop:754 length:369 start_codon:yes stop_codon:yes gene_type:complete